MEQANAVSVSFRRQLLEQGLGFGLAFKQEGQGRHEGIFLVRDEDNLRDLEEHCQPYQLGGAFLVESAKVQGRGWQGSEARDGDDNGIDVFLGKGAHHFLGLVVCKGQCLPPLLLLLFSASRTRCLEEILQIQVFEYVGLYVPNARVVRGGVRFIDAHDVVLVVLGGDSASRVIVWSFI